MNTNNKSITVLGSTGSVGTQALDVARTQNLKVNAITANVNIKKAEEQIREFKPEYCVMTDEKSASLLKNSVADTGCKILSGKDSVIEVISKADSDIVINSITGKAGLLPSLAVIEKGTPLALANKETIVCAGDIVMKKAKEKNVPILPVDSEHCAVFQSISNNRHCDISRIILTASGGPFFGKSREELCGITPEMALAHPTWNMGAKITIDSATLMNKGFEVIEARYLFDVAPENIDVVVHPESIVHSMVEYIDMAVLAQLSVPDMRLCVQYALSYPDRVAGTLERLDLTRLSTLNFKKPDKKTFKLLDLAYKVLDIGGDAGCILNAANEVAVSAFLNRKISFTDIMDLVENVVLSSEINTNPTIEDIEKSDLTAREKAQKLI